MTTHMTALSVLFSCAALAQTFDAASVKPFQGKGEKERPNAIVLAPGGVTLRNVNVKTVMAAAYGVKDFQISGPAWLDSEPYEIIAKTAAPATGDQLRKMLQDLLAGRFQMTLHRENKELSVYAMTAVKKTSALHEAKEGVEPGMGFAKGGFGFQSCSMAKLAEYLSHFRGTDRPVVDLTGIEGVYDFTIAIGDSSEDPAEAKRATEGVFKDGSILNIVASQLGLKIEGRKMAYEVLVVDRVERPSAN